MSYHHEICANRCINGKSGFLKTYQSGSKFNIQGNKVKCLQFLTFLAFSSEFKCWYIFLSVLRVKDTVCDNSAVECMAEDALKYLSLNVDERLTLDSPKVSQLCICISHDDIIKWKHFPCNWSFVRGINRSLVNSLHKGQWCGALMFSLICSWMNGWVNNGEAGDLRRHRVHYDVTVMCITHWPLGAVNVMLKVLFSKSFF